MNTFPVHYLTNAVPFFLQENADSFLTPQMKKIAVIAASIFAALTLLYCLGRCCLHVEVEEKIEKRDYPDGSEFEGVFDKHYHSRFLKGKKTTFEGDVEEGTFNANNKLYGPGKITLADGTIVKGNFSDGNLHDKGSKTYPDGTIEEGFYQYSQLQGYGKITRPDGTIEEGLYDKGILARAKPKRDQNSQLQGYGKITRPDGTIEEGLYDKGTLARAKPKRDQKETTTIHPTSSTT